MIKKNYEKPSIKVYEMKSAGIICTSGGDDYWGYTAPGTGEDKNRLV